MAALLPSRQTVVVILCLLAVLVSSVRAQPDQRLIQAVQAQDAALIEQLLRDGVDVNATRADGVTALLWAAHWDDQTAADLLLEAGADPNAAEDRGSRRLLEPPRTRASR